MDATLDPLVAAAIHDAKNALMAIDLQLAQMQSRPASADFPPTRAAIARVADQLSELLTLYRAQGGQLRLAIDDHDLADFIDDLVTELGPLPGGLTLTLDHPAISKISAWAFDAFLIKLALLDALRNAVRHAHASVKLTLSQQLNGGICFVISDDGPGYPLPILNGDTTLTGTHGTALGLTFARLIAARHATPAGQHGHVELANTPGATLRLYLP